MHLSLVTVASVLSASRGRPSKAALAQQAAERCEHLYGGLIADQLDPRQQYTLVRVGEAEFAFSSYDSLVSGLRQAWDLGLMPEAHKTVIGAELPDHARRLDGVDPDLQGLQASDLVRRKPFSRD